MQKSNVSKSHDIIVVNFSHIRNAKFYFYFTLYRNLHKYKQLTSRLEKLNFHRYARRKQRNAILSRLVYIFRIRSK